MALEIFKLVGSIFVDNAAANESIAKTDEKAQSVGQSLLNGVGTAAKWGTAILGGATAAATAMVGFASNSAAAADEVDKMSQKIGLSKEGYQEWAYVMGQNGMEISKMQTGMKTLVAQMDGAAGGTKSAQENFAALGVSIYDSTGKLKDQETMMNEVMYALADMENGTEKARLATELFGKSGSEMIPMLNQGSGAMQELTDRAHELGLVMSDDAVNSGVQLGDLMDDVKQSVSMLATKLGTSLFPILIQVCEMIISNMPMIQGIFAQMEPVVTSLMNSLLPPLMELASTLLPILVDIILSLMPVLTSVMQTILPAIVQFIQMLLPPILEIVQQLLPTLMALLQPILTLLQPILALLQPIIDILMALLQPLISLINLILPPVITLITEIIGVLLEFLTPALQFITEIIQTVFNAAIESISPVIEKLKENFTKVWTAIKEFLSPLLDNMKNNMKNAFSFIQAVVEIVINKVSNTVEALRTVFSNTFNALVGIIKPPINNVISMLNKMIDAMNMVKFDIPDWVPALGGKVFGFNIPRIPMLATGGEITRGGKAIINEAGAELVDLPSGAKVTPLTKGGGSSIEATFEEMLYLFQKLIEELPDMIREGMNGNEIKWNDRELGRLISKHAR